MAVHTFQVGLLPGYLMVIDGDGYNIWDITAGKDYSFAVIDLVYGGCLTYKEGGLVMYKTKDRVQINQSGTDFYIIKESDVVLAILNYPEP